MDISEICIWLWWVFQWWLWFKQFDKIAATGQLFLLYRGKTGKTPQDTIVKVSFDNIDNPFKPKQIS